MSNYSAGGSKGPYWPLGGVLGVPVTSTLVPPPYVLTERQLAALSERIPSPRGGTREKRPEELQL
jgi:hypothetical protein